jgi:predicted DNA-binding protein
MADKKSLLLRLDADLAEQLQAVAAVEGRPVSEVVREAIRALVDERRRDRSFQRRLRQTAREQAQLLDRLRGS